MMMIWCFISIFLVSGKLESKFYLAKNNKSEMYLIEVYEAKRLNEQDKYSDFEERQRLSSKQVSTGPIMDKHGRPMMGSKNADCDDGKGHLYRDLSGQQNHMTCSSDEKVASLNATFTNSTWMWRHTEQRINCISIPKEYSPRHYCINDTITYKRMNRLPRYGPHRPVWGVFGEYKYIPPQRWLHNVEHGSVILLYHPCVNKTQLQTVRRLVTGCIRKHIITPSRLVLPTAPIALVAWGCSLEMIAMDEELIKRFIKEKGLHGPEGHYPKQGQYNHLLIHAAKPPQGSDVNDTVLCPQQQYIVHHL